MRIDPTLNSLARRLQTPASPGAAKGGAGVEQGTDAKAQEARIRQAAQEFEALFLEQMVKEMRSSIPAGGALQKTRGEELFQEMLDGEYVRGITEAGGIGLTDALVRALR